MDSEFRDRIRTAEKKVTAIQLLIDMAKEKGRIPIKDDFTEDEIVLIKGMLGTFPRALEFVGLKEMSEHYKEKLARKRGKKNRKVDNGPQAI